MDDDIKVLASYVTYRQLYDTTRDIYLIVSKFIEDVILESGFHFFGLQ